MRPHPEDRALPRRSDRSPRCAAGPRPSRAPRAEAGRREAPPADPAARAVTLALLALVALRGAGALVSAPGAWGLDTLHDLPPAAALALALLPLAALAPPLARPLAAGLEALGRGLGRRGPWPYVAVALVAFLALLPPRDVLRFTGDSSLRLTAITVRGRVGLVFPQASPLDVAVNVRAARWLHDHLGLSGPAALQAAGAAVGAAWAAAALALARALAPGGLALAAALLATLLCGVPVHFAGYDKYGPLLAGLALAAAGLARLAAGGRPWLLAAGMAVALAGHRSALLFVPAALAPLLLAARARPGSPRREALLAAALVGVAAAVALPGAARAFVSVDRGRHLPVGWTPARLGDALELLLLLAPLAPAALVAWLARPRGARAGPGTVGAALALAPALAQLALVRGSQGALRDWDMHTGAASVVVLAGAAALVAALGPRAARAGGAGAAARRTLGIAVLGALAAAAATWAIHADPWVQRARVERALADRSAWTDEAWARAQDFLGVYATHEGRADDAIAHWKAAIQAAPNPRFYDQIGLAYVYRGQLAAGRAWLDSAHARDPLSPDPYVGWAVAAVGEDSLARAEALLDSALALRPGKWDAVAMRRRVRAERARRAAAAP